ncbi:MAG: hypothetical protein HC860_10295 [Alkalinema sp. RU_4_3]|nr:hypothetical protein [Alkalinema sp. RU_4_3]
MNSNFRTIFFSLLSIAFLSGGTSVYLANQPNPNDQQIAVQNTCLDTWKLCTGGIAGLVGGRNLNQPDNDNDQPT